MITYDQFIANVNENDLAVLTSFSVGKRIICLTQQEADAMIVQCERLREAGMCWRIVYAKENKAGGVEFQFDGYVDPVGAGYIAKAARERVMISRDPLPTTP
jgi:hypothetical protein